MAVLWSAWQSSVIEASTDLQEWDQPDSGKLHLLRTQTSFGDRSFAVAAPRSWNNLPDAIRDSSLTFLTSTKPLKSYLFVNLTVTALVILTGAREMD